MTSNAWAWTTSRWESRASDDVLALVDRAASSIRGDRRVGLTEQVTDDLLNNAGLAGDEVLRAEALRVGHANVERFLELLLNPGRPIEVPEESISVAAALVQREKPLSALVEAYRIGQKVYVNLWLDALALCTSDAVLLTEALRYFHERYFAFMDTLVASTVDEYARQERMWRQKGDARRAHTVQEILQGRLVSPATAERRLGHKLAKYQLAAILSIESSPETVAEEVDLQAVLSDLARELPHDYILRVPTGTTALYAWIACSRPPDLDSLRSGARVPEGVRVPVGGPAPGLAGFRSSHEDAQAAHHVAVRSGDRSRLVTYADVAVVTMLNDDRTRLQRFVTDELGDLAEQNDNAKRLRETLQVALEESLNASSTAKRLFIHKNTALYRLRRAEELRGRPPGERRLELELALRVLDTYGDSLLD